MTEPEHDPAAGAGDDPLPERLLPRQWHSMWNAWVFFTRLPAPPGVRFGPRLLDHASRWFPWVGAVLGLAYAAATLAAEVVLPVALAATVPVVASLLLTGAFHEDGLADTFDGFGGGWTRADVLRIMRDSRLGTYGTAALVVSLLVRWQAWVALLAADTTLLVLLPLVQAWSRGWALTAMWSLPYAREEDVRAKPLAATFDARSSVVAIVPVLLLVAAALLTGTAPLVLGVAAAVALGLRTVLLRWFGARIGGWTGDTLGASQQLHEVALLVVLVTGT